MKTIAARGLRRIVFASGLAVTGVAAVLSPDWSATLKAQGYYGTVDLGLSVEAPARVSPGEAFELNVFVHNQGPDTAHRVRTVATVRQLHHLGGIGCNGATYPQCALTDSLVIGGLSGYQLVMQVPANARNHVQFSASATSDDTESRPGDEIAVIKIPVYVPLDLRTEIACARAEAAARGMVRCSIQFSNTEANAAYLPLLQARVDAVQSPQWSCESSQPGLCATATATGNDYEARPVLLPGWGGVTFFVTARTSTASPAVGLDAEVRLNPAMGETDLVPTNNRNRLTYEPPLFGDGFEPRF
ncbi:MAG: hypothetical protein JNN30_03215 [Rhodanobacteraceae bacterium]|nr:hypothetical protein [Rhodanobacteraceae bacterium]